MLPSKSILNLLTRSQNWHLFSRGARKFSSVASVSPLSRQLNAKIKMTGPVTVADFMKEVLINPTAGYYPQQESIGRKGDFITSPELNQIFGEMIAVWILTEWKKIGSPRPMQIVELGPGKGTLMSDILRVLKHFNCLKGVSIQLVELSAKLRETQAKLLCAEATLGQEGFITSGSSTDGDCPVFWHNHICEVPQGTFTCVIAHEFFDALPVHKLRKTEEGWREILVDLDPSSEDIKFRYVLSKEGTPISSIFAPKVSTDDPRTDLEVCPEAGVLVQSLVQRFEEDGGFLLLADYGHLGEKGDTFRGFSQHKLHEPLENPGLADLTADVDFGYLRSCIGDKALAYGPVAQADFLNKLGIHVRLQALLDSESVPEEHKQALKSSVKMMTDPDAMGHRFKFFSVFPNVLKEHNEKFPVLGFD